MNLTLLFSLAAAPAVNGYIFGLATMRAAAARSSTTVAAPSPTAPAAKSSEVASKMVGGFPASSSLVDAGFTGDNAMTEADRAILSDPMFVSESTNYPDSPFSSAEMVMIAKRFLHQNQVRACESRDYKLIVQLY